MEYHNVNVYGALVLAGSAGSAGQVLLSQGAGVQTAWGSVDLTVAVTGILPVANGGTGTNTAFTQGSVIFAGVSGIYTQDATGLFYNSTDKQLGIGTNTLVAQLTFGGTYTAGVTRVDIGGTLQSSSVGTHTILFNRGQLDLTAAVGPVALIRNFFSGPSITSSANNPDITQIYSGYFKVDTQAGYTGTIANIRTIVAAAPVLLGSVTTVSVLTGVYTEGFTNGGNTSGTLTNRGVNIVAHSGAGAAGGTVTNNGIVLTVSTGSGAGTTNNRGINITGNGGSGGAGTTNNHAIYSDSTANSYLLGHLGLNITAPTAAMLQIVNSADVIGASIKAFAGQTSNLTTWLSSASATLASVDINGLGLFAGVTLTDATNLVVGSTTGSKIGTATSQKLAFHNSTPVIQRVGAAQAAVATTGSALVSFGYTTAAQADGIVTLLNEIRAALVEKGLIKGAA